jgi:hypothetical protein
MRTFLVLITAGCLGAIFYYQKHHEPATAAATTTAVQSAPANPSQATAQQPVSEHNWMKRSLDRATEVRNQSRAQTQQSQDP